MHLFFIFVISISAIIGSASATESESQREAVVSPRTKRFYKSNRARQYVSFGGAYSSDYNSKQYQLTSRYLHQSRNFINEMNFDHETEYADTDSGKNKKYDVKKTELYDLALSSKARINDSKNYGVFYHRSIYDDLSKYYYDTRTALGLGRMFFGEKLEWDVSLGYHDVKTYGNDVDVITSWRANFRLNRNLTFIQRAYWFFDHESIDNGFKTSLVYRLRNNLSFEVRHNFEQRRYESDDNKMVENFVNRSVTLSLIFDLN
ncbi:MAG: hypothetical protein A2887_01495 [Alphaproteobacteria bacterium RIFCSPLOWO2_01_FULL_40_26]|nr:MAG: hypothetical protein A3D15_04165 [Alphaproteobacteria bacterium RIFCSPHIGHO2_02_FULL_40_34]OFW88311.1 MAG: hypothetical protein A2794_04845 [Alphaproteobacteria bacterium RIFCSPHIGHO2_01_FULL_40_8]OFW94958.1 MAG: hypothetical protein A2887_01495 [Alphaproteobacteria bacterium RIFCSPLOWO2_01_FULL_40_26]OFX09895.1 MAG: hypothetical protein A3H30_06095 [Alphaproteobacteria bacterium RIFCSPLOWO2_02_FULL_40_19]OFX10784.1 MAG: hypothetical protein A3G22_01675 [Alphaproteobacteria bacterium RI